MLKVLKAIPVIKERIEVDQYIPIKIRWGQHDASGDELIYWRTGDIKYSMLEIGISALSGELRSLTIVSADNISFVSEIFPECDTFGSGTPVFDVSNWIGKKTVDDVGPFEVQYCNKKLNIIISKNHIIEEIISGRVSFGLDANMNICKISVKNLSNAEALQVKDTLEYVIMTKTIQ